MKPVSEWDRSGSPQTNIITKVTVQLGTALAPPGKSPAFAQTAKVGCSWCTANSWWPWAWRSCVRRSSTGAYLPEQGTGHRKEMLSTLPVLRNMRAQVPTAPIPNANVCGSERDLIFVVGNAVPLPIIPSNTNEDVDEYHRLITCSLHFHSRINPLWTTS